MLENVSYDIALLLKKMADEDELSFRKVFDHYKEPFYATAYKMTHNSTITEEIVQEVFVTIWVKRKLVGAAKKPEGYVFTILHNCIYSHFRKLIQERQLKLKIEQRVEWSEDMIETLLIEKENRQTLENVINQLPSQQRLVYRMAKQEGLSRNEIATQLNISPNTVKNHLLAAVEYIRAYFEKGASFIIWIIIWIRL
ncbi:MAG: sigma-70 family RNA polymerase sigma factor [Ginsengibacter sp.]